LRRAARIDANQPQIVADLRGVGCVVWSTAGVGNGFPDIVVGYQGRNYLFEIKDPAKPPSARALTPKEREFFLLWNKWRSGARTGQVDIIETADDAMKIVGIERKG
jgi:hypothetical protein